MNVESLRWLLSVAGGATVGETAERFHTTQPVVTRGLQRLGAEFGAPLTERTGRRVRLTFAGQIVARSARIMVAELDEARRAVDEAVDPATGTVHLGFLSPLGTWLIPRLLHEFQLSHPGVRFRLRHDGATRILQALLDGELDLLLTAEPRDPRVQWEPLFEEELVLALPRTHRLAERRRIPAAELREESWVLHPAGYDLRQHAEKVCAAAGFAPQVTFEGPDLTTLYALIGTGSGIGLFPVNPPPLADVRQVPLSPRIARTVGLVQLRGRHQPPAAEAFAAMIRAQPAPSFAAG